MFTSTYFVRRLRSTAALITAATVAVAAVAVLPPTPVAGVEIPEAALQAVPPSLRDIEYPEPDEAPVPLTREELNYLLSIAQPAEEAPPTPYPAPKEGMELAPLAVEPFVPDVVIGGARFHSPDGWVEHPNPGVEPNTDLGADLNTDSHADVSHRDSHEVVAGGAGDAQGAKKRSRRSVNCRQIFPTPHTLCDEVLRKYDELGSKWLGFPTTGMLRNPDGRGWRAHFNLGAIYFSPTTGAHAVAENFMPAWGRKGYEGGQLGYPTSDPIAVAPNVGMVQMFERGRIFASLGRVASVQGLIDAKYGEYGSEQGVLGYPVHDEMGTPDKQGRFNRFDNGMIYWHPAHGAHPIVGTVLEQWSAAGYEKGRYGYPIADPVVVDGVYVSQRFQHGELRGYTSDVVELSKIAVQTPTELSTFVSSLVKALQSGFPHSEWENAIRNELIVARYSLAYAHLDGVLDRSTNTVKWEYRERAVPTTGSECSTNPDDIRFRGKAPFTSPGNANTREGDLFFSKANTSYAQHGHTGIFVNNPQPGATDEQARNQLKTVEAINKDEGIRELQGKDRVGVCKPVVLRVKSATPEDRKSAVKFAQSKIGKSYNSSFIISKRENPDAYNCSSLVWFAYKRAPSRIDLAEERPWLTYAGVATGFVTPPGFNPSTPIRLLRTSGVYPLDIRFSRHVEVVPEKGS